MRLDQNSQTVDITNLTYMDARHERWGPELEDYARNFNSPEFSENHISQLESHDIPSLATLEKSLNLVELLQGRLTSNVTLEEAINTLDKYMIGGDCKVSCCLPSRSHPPAAY